MDDSSEYENSWQGSTTASTWKASCLYAEAQAIEDHMLLAVSCAQSLVGTVLVLRCGVMQHGVLRCTESV